jgi:hypothetical protein
LPAAFPLRSKTSRGRGHAPGAGDSDEEFGQHDTSPTERKAYDGLGLGRPSVSKAGWLLRRSSSGAISSATSGSMSGDGSPSGTANAVHRMSLLSLLLHLVHEIDGRAHLMSNRLAAATATHSTQTFPTEVEHPESPRVEPDRVKFVGVIDNNDSVLAQKVPARSATTNHLRKRAGSASRKRDA